MINIIKTLSIEVNASHFKNAFEFQSRLDKWFHENLMPVIESVFEKIGDEHKYIKIDRLELNLSTIRLSSLNEPMNKSLQVHLYQSVMENLKSQINFYNRRFNDSTHKIKSKGNFAQISPNNIGEPQPNGLYEKNERKVHTYLTFFLTGSLPWWVNRHEKDELTHHFENSCVKNPSVFSSILTNLLELDSLPGLLRLIKFLPDRVLNEQFNKFSPVQGSSSVQLNLSYVPKYFFSEKELSAREKFWLDSFSQLFKKTKYVHKISKYIISNTSQAIEWDKPEKRISEMATDSQIHQNNDIQHSQNELGEEENKFNIHNGGLVLAGAYLNTLFKQLGIIKSGKFVSWAQQIKSVSLLEYLATGTENPKEFNLVFNKVLCGVHTSYPISTVKLTQSEKNETQQLIQSMINHWKGLKNTSIKGFQNSFLKRPALLELKEGVWHVLIERKPYDMLLDSLPWMFSIIQNPWAKYPIQVQW